MSANGDNKETTLKQITFVEAQEMGRHNQSMLTDSGGLNRVSEYRSGKATMKQESRPQARPTLSTMACSNCGSKTHSSMVSDRRKNCKAFNVSCRKCGKTGHYDTACRSKLHSTKVEEETVQATEQPAEELDSPHGNWPRY